MIVTDLCCNLRNILSQVSVLQLEKYLIQYHPNLSHYNRYNSHFRTQYYVYLREMKHDLHEVCISSLFLRGDVQAHFLNMI